MAARACSNSAWTTCSLASLWLALACSGASPADDAVESGGTNGVGGYGGQSSVSGTSAQGGARSSGGAKALGGAAPTAGAPSVGAGGLFLAMGGMAAQRPPPAQSNGDSPYLPECHGDTAMCRDVVNLRCLGLRDGSDIYGYGCSNECSSDEDCSTAPSHAEASAGCVDFVTSRHCLLVCLRDGVERSCPSGMACKSYPGAAIGYCLWP